MGKGSMILKATGILMIISAAVSIVLGIIGIIGMFVFTSDQLSGSAGALAVVAAVVAVIAGVLQLIAGIAGLRNSEKPEKAMTCIILGAIVLLVNVADQILSNFVTAAELTTSTVFSIIINLALPVIYIIGAILNKRNV